MDIVDALRKVEIREKFGLNRALTFLLVFL